MKMSSFVELIFPVKGQPCQEHQGENDCTSTRSDGDSIDLHHSDPVIAVPRPSIDGMRRSDPRVSVGMLLSRVSQAEDVSGLLFQSAVTTATYEKRPVLFISPRRMESLPPLVHRMPKMSPEILPLIRVSHPRTISELHRYLAALGSCFGDKKRRVQPPPPGLLILNSLECFVGDERGTTAFEERLARTLAIAREFAGWAKDGDKVTRILVGLSMKQDLAPSLVSKLHLFADEVWAVSASKETEEEEELQEEVMRRSRARLEMSCLTTAEDPEGSHRISFELRDEQRQYFPLELSRD